MITRKQEPNRFSLHDAQVVKLEKVGEDLLLHFGYGFVDVVKNEMVDGVVKIEGVCFESSYVSILEYTDVLCGNVGHFKGEKRELSDFLKDFNGGKTMNLIGEYDGFQSYVLTGFLNDQEKVFEVIMDLYYLGDIVYRC